MKVDCTFTFCTIANSAKAEPLRRIYILYDVIHIGNQGSKPQFLLVKAESSPFCFIKDLIIKCLQKLLKYTT